uniref:Proline dehydrogenase 1, mitochondrial n=1 Tax=Anthurium amnicola TaxID=1678845 RepID=A0A1D1YN66_9ARAE
MDHELDKTLIHLDNKASDMFCDFMTRVAKTEELTIVGNQLLIKFHQELEFFRRPPLQKTSKVVQYVIEANQTCRLKAYLESGSRHAYLDMQNIRKLNLCQRGLQDHLIKVKALLDELGCLSEDGIAITQTVNHSTDKCFNDCCMNQASSCKEVELELASHRGKCSDEEIETLHPPGERILFLAILMRVMYNMLKLDYEMQEKIVLSLNLNSSSEELESYCLVWDLRPFVNDNIMQQCWRFVPQSTVQ